MATAAAAATLVGCSFIPAGAVPFAPRAASLAPADTLVFATVNLRPSVAQLAQARVLANDFTSQPNWNRAVETLQSFSEASVSLADDVLPLIDGEVAVAETGTPFEPTMIVLAHSSNPDKLAQYLVSLSGSQTGTSQPSAQPGPNGSHLLLNSPETVAASLQGWLVISNQRAALDQALNRIANGGTDNLEQQSSYQTLTKRLPADRLGLVYVDEGRLDASLASFVAANPDTAQAAQAVSRANVQAAMSISATFTGLDFHTESIGTSQTAADLHKLGLDQLGEPTDAFNQLPFDTLAAGGVRTPPAAPGLDDLLNGSISGFYSDFGKDPATAPMLHPAEWFGGQIALGADQGTIGGEDGQPSLYLVASVTEPDLAQADLDTLSALLPPEAVRPIRVNGVDFNAVFDRNLALTYGMAGNWLFATNGDVSVVTGGSQHGGLSANPRFGQLHTALGSSPVNAFADLTTIRSTIEQTLDPESARGYNTLVSPFVTPLTFVGGGSTTDPNGDTHGHFFLGISGT